MLVGWQPNPTRRGAPAILESCLFTIFACTWSILHLNIAAPEDGKWTRFKRKLVSAILTVLLPEIILTHAILERNAAIESLDSLSGIEDIVISYEPWSWRRFSRSISDAVRNLSCGSTRKKNGKTATAGSTTQQIELATLQSHPTRIRWTLTHSYYANMGGLRLRSSDGNEICKLSATSFSTIALTTRQFASLRRPGVIQAAPDISEEQIKDRSKTDYFTKGITLAQFVWLLVTLITRAARHLAISPLEILTAAFAVCAVMTYIFSWNKPQNVDTATSTVAARPLTARDIRRLVQLQPKEMIVLLAGTTNIGQGSQFNRIHNGNLELLAASIPTVSIWLVGTVLVFGAIHISAWDFTFPTEAERILWRICSIATATVPLLFLVNTMISSASHALEEDEMRFENGILSLWEDYYIAKKT